MPIISNYPAFRHDSTCVRYIEWRCRRTKAWANHNAAAGTNATAGIRQIGGGTCQRDDN